MANSSSSSRAVAARAPVVVPASGKHTASLIFFHGLGDQGDGWSSLFKTDIRLKHIKYIFPNAASIPVTLNFGMSMPAWYDIYGLTPNTREDDQGIEAAKKYAHALIDDEVKNGIPPHRIIIGGFSMGGALAVYAGLTYGQKLAGICSLSGFLLQRDKLPGVTVFVRVNSKLVQTRVAVFQNHSANMDCAIWLGHGTADFIVPYNFGQMTEQALKKFHSNVQFHSYDVDHGSTPQEHRDLKDFVSKQLPE